MFLKYNALIYIPSQKTSGTLSWSWETTSYRYAPYFLSESWVLWGTTTIRNCGYYEVQLPSGIVGIMRYNYHQELWVLWGTTTIRNCGYYEIQLQSGIVGIMRHNYHQELWVLWGTTTIRNCGYYETQLPSGIVGIMRYNYHQELWVLWDTTFCDIFKGLLYYQM
jgi:hypothetical protein